MPDKIVYDPKKDPQVINIDEAFPEGELDKAREKARKESESKNPEKQTKEQKSKNKNEEAKKLKKLHNNETQKKMLKLLTEKKQWLISSDFVKAFPEKIKNRGRARGLLKLLAKNGKVQMLKNPKTKKHRQYVFGLSEWKEPTANNLKAILKNA